MAAFGAKRIGLARSGAEDEHALGYVVSADGLVAVLARADARLPALGAESLVELRSCAGVVVDDVARPAYNGSVVVAHAADSIEFGKVRSPAIADAQKEASQTDGRPSGSGPSQDYTDRQWPDS